MTEDDNGIIQEKMAPLANDIYLESVSRIETVLNGDPRASYAHAIEILSCIAINFLISACRLMRVADREGLLDTVREKVLEASQREGGSLGIAFMEALASEENRRRKLH